MAEMTWDNGGAPVRKAGMPLWAKILAGCGIAVLLMMATCGGLIWWGISRGTAAVDQVWAEMVKDVEALRTEAGARALYRDNPGLARNYPTEADFIKASEDWRSRLGEIPAKRPSLGELMQGKGGGFSIHSNNDHRRVTYRFRKGGRLVLEWEQEALVDIRME